MPISHLFAEGVGPFKDLHLDLQGPDGHPSLGPHILAGVNGSGKSTILKAIAWCLTSKADGFPDREWWHFVHGYPQSRAVIILDIAGVYRYAWAATKDSADGWQARLHEWVSQKLTLVGIESSKFELQDAREGIGSLPESNEYNSRRQFNSARFGGPKKLDHGARFNPAAYSSARSVRYVENLEIALKLDKVSSNRFAFESTVQNEAIQSWLLGLYSKRAIAKERHESSSRYTMSFDALERGLRCICGDDVSIVVDIEPKFQPRLRIGNRTLNFSQIADGVKATIGWLSDFMMRSEASEWDPKVAEQKPGLLLFDEIEGFLHPLWQRRLLPALREALPQTQSIVTSHSPFVISSCPSSVLHALKVHSDGSAYAEPPVRAPIGESITSTLKEIFGVDSRFDVETEEELAEWNHLNRSRLEHRLTTKERVRFQNLSRILAGRSEQLRSIVDPIAKLPRSAVDKLTNSTPTRQRRSRVASSR